MIDAMKRLVPAAQWLPSYKSEDLKGDLAAGLTTAVMLVPQGMAYAMLAGLPPIVGLYAATLPLALYALLGTSRELAVGPVAMVSLLVASGIAPLVEGGGEAWIVPAVMLSLLVGAIQLTMGALRLGFLVNFLSYPVLGGFTAAASLIIGIGQLQNIMGVALPREDHLHATLLAAIRQAGDVHLPTLLLGLASIATLLLLKRWIPRFPRALVVVMATTGAVWALDMEAMGVKIVGEVPAGLPPLGLPPLDPSMLASLAPTALTISLVGFVGSISMARAFASRRRYEVSPNQELIALGAANLGASLVSAFPITGGLSRTAVNAQAGARTPMASLITAAIVAVILALFTPLFHGLPRAALAAIIITAVAGLFDVGEVKHLYKVSRGDLGLWILTFVATLSLGIELGILAGVGASILWMVARTTRPHVAILGRIPGTRAWRNLRNHPDAEAIPGVVGLRIDAQLSFANASFLKETVHELIACDPPPRALVIDASSINELDASADAALHALHRDLRDRGVALMFAQVKVPVMKVMERSGLDLAVGRGHFFLEVDDAMEAARRQTSTRSAAAA